MKTYFANLWYALIGKPEKIRPLGGGGGGPIRPL
jgi:hypothetical protein